MGAGCERLGWVSVCGMRRDAWRDGERRILNENLT